jgi:phage terminase large subunit-like protein
LLFKQFTGRTVAPTGPLHEAWLVVGRRGGKSFILAVVAVFLACFRDWKPYLGPGEVGTIMILAKDRAQARSIKRFISGLLRETPMLSRVLAEETAEAIRLHNRVVIEIHTASYRSTRGYTLIAALLDEIAIWDTDETSAEPDVEVINAIKPGMATIPGSMLLCANSPHARRGALWEAYRKHFGQMAIRCSCGRLAPAPFECDRAAGLHRCAHGGRPGLCAGRVSRAVSR